jgi:Flp pilus assembly protein TadD
VEESRVASLCRRAWRERRRGDERRAMMALREAAYENEEEARLWALFGVQSLRAGRHDFAVQALTHAVWLRERNHEPAKAKITRALLDKATGEQAA